MKKSPLLLLVCILLCSNLSFAQTFEKTTQWLSSQLNQLVKEDKSKSLKVNDKESIPTFNFKGCQMNMNIDAKSDNKDFNLGINMSWLLKDVQKVSYTREKEGGYELKLLVPADRMKMTMGFGHDNSLTGSFNLKDEDKGDSKTNFTLHTQNEDLVKQVVQKFEESVRTCRNSK